MGLTKIVNKLYFQPRRRELERYVTDGEAIQREVMQYLVERAKDTEYGRKHLFSTIKSYEDFVQNIPVNTYEELKSDIDRMRHGERNILWPGQVRWYAKSSGTTNDKSKFIPVSHEGLQTIHYQGGKDVIAYYLSNHPESRLFNGKGLILGGSHSPNYNLYNSLVGDLSAILVEHMPLLGDMLRVPSRETLLMSEWTAKMQAIVQEVATARVGSLSGVPSWMLVLLKEVLQATGRESITEVWPDLEVFFHGGISFTPYRSTYAELIPSERMRYEETYNASEGFFAIQDDPAEAGMLLMLDYGIFYEFIPLDELPASGDYSSCRALRLEEVELGRDYAMVISTLGGLYRYIIGDTVRFTSLHPYRIVITGRTKHFINAFGEEVMVANTDAALSEACRRDGRARVSEYTAAPRFFLDEGKGRHEWLIEFEEPPRDLATFTSDLDTALRALNSDYDAKRYEDMTLLPLTVDVAPKGLFHRWLESEGKLGGQHKVPRLSNSRHYLEALLALVTPSSTEL